ncbi:MAG: 6-phosphogluconolactonase [Microbacteriaceae bacterium]
MRELTVLADRAAVEETVAELLVKEIIDVQASRELCTIVLTGGTVGIGTLRAVVQSPRCADVAWDRVRILWGDERYVPAGHPDRNDGQADDALLRHVPLQPRNVFRFPASDSGLSLDSAAAAFENTIVSAFPEGFRADVTLCGIGPDGHVASLFPGHDHGMGTVVAVHDSPKPPSERLSLTFDALNTSRKIWIVCAGTDKADAVHRLMSGDATNTPAVLLNGLEETMVFADTSAASAL